ncbi:hypothetical protein POM88_050902 [Heracleum sosnowskyi]|uniref:C3H1-type domain-containing protein n=1 Tax=Heracleum sosnowskyi TaxID=360622 RepID=A0AAD8M1X6_9APIA|nr:hypothetical protein POM88_050902 [Heracleum sosnowskyi]
MASNLLKGTLCVNPNQARRQRITQIQWKCPPEFTMDPNWRVAAGEESTEAVAQRRVDPDPRPDAAKPEASDNSDGRTLVIPITAIEEEGNLINNSSAEFLTTAAMDGETISLSIDALNALNAVALRQGEPPISMGLFMQWLNSDKVRRFISGQSVPEIQSMLNDPTHSVPFVSSKSDQPNFSTGDNCVGQNTGVVSKPRDVEMLNKEFEASDISGHSTPLMNPSSLSGNTQIGQGRLTLKPPQKLCNFFNTTMGCRYGAGCRFRHSKSDQASPSGVEALPSAKRVKPGSERGSLCKRR